VLNTYLTNNIEKFTYEGFKGRPSQSPRLSTKSSLSGFKAGLNGLGLNSFGQVGSMSQFKNINIIGGSKGMGGKRLFGPSLGFFYNYGDKTWHYGYFDIFSFSIKSFSLGI
tara:strand:- start:2757 stop:3089 length:333 start_codon:yes stop_codon:yes gene_type:complete